MDGFFLVQLRYERKDSKAVEVRWCDSIDDIKEYIPKLKREYNI